MLCQFLLLNANLSIVFGPNFREANVSEGEKAVEESWQSELPSEHCIACEHAMSSYQSSFSFIFNFSYIHNH